MIAKKSPAPPLKVLVFGSEQLDVQYYLSQDYDDIGQAALEIPEAVAWINQMLQYYVAQELIEYRAVKEAEATAYFELRSTTFVQKYGDKMTEKALEHAVELDPRVIEAIRLHADSKAFVSLLRIHIDLLMQRMELIRTVEATRRHVSQSEDPYRGRTPR